MLKQKKAETQSLKLANHVRSQRKALAITRNELKFTNDQLEQSQTHNKHLRQLLNKDHEAVSRYLGIVLSKLKTDLAPSEKKQVRTLMQDNSEGQAKDTMAAWDTILSLQQKLGQERQLIKALYEQIISEDQYNCGDNNNHQSCQSKSAVLDLIKNR